MSDPQTPEPADPSFSGIDLAQSFLPDWAKSPSGPTQHSGLAEKFPERDRPSRDGRRPDRRPGDQRNFRDSRGPQGRRDARSPRGARRDPRERDRERPEPRPEPIQTPAGWTAKLVPDPRGIDGLARQIKSTAKAYPLFDLAFLILEKPDRYLIELSAGGGGEAELLQFAPDGTLWTSAKEALRHAVSRHLGKYYRREQVTVEPPKGNFTCIAVCGDIVLGPPNHHAYQTKLREVHAARFRNVPFEAFKSRVQMIRTEEAVEKWKTSQTVKEEFYPLETPEGSEPERLADLAAVENHFRSRHLDGLLTRVSGPVEVAGSAAAASSPGVRMMASRLVSDLRRFPLPLAHHLGQALAPAGLQIFKAHENITYVSIARPRYLDRTASPVAEGLSGILDFLESHPRMPRPDQWKALLAQRKTPEDETAREGALASDLSWLIHQGHVIDYARQGLEAVRKPKPPREQPQRKPAPAKPQTAAPAQPPPAGPEQAPAPGQE